MSSQLLATLDSAAQGPQYLGHFVLQFVTCDLPHPFDVLSMQLLILKETTCYKFSFFNTTGSCSQIQCRNTQALLCVLQVINNMRAPLF